jgi:hydrogenase expression/formation protein HypE
MRSHKYGRNAAIIGRLEADSIAQENSGKKRKGSAVTMMTKLKGSRIIDTLYGEGLPRIC